MAIPIRADTNWSYLLPICVAATLGGFLFGFDSGVISGVIDPLTKHFDLSDAVRGWASGCVLIGCAGGVLLAGPFADRLGRRFTLFLAALAFLISAIGTAYPPNFNAFILFRILGGVGIGIASMTTPMYIAEVAPAHLRGRLVTINQIAIMAGIAGTAVINYFIAKGHPGDEGQVWLVSTGWRWMFAVGILPAGLFCALSLWMPESPRWLLEQGKGERAQTILGKIGGDAYAKAEAQLIREGLSGESGTWAEVFSPKLKKPLLIGIALAILQQVTGINVFLYFGVTIFNQMSKSTGVDAGMLTQIIINGSCVLFTLIAIMAVDGWGRRPLMVIGSIGMGLSLLAMGLMAQFMHDPANASALMLTFSIVYIGCFGLSVGPVTWVILSEIYPTAVRGRALGLATLCLWLADYAVTQTFPMMDGKDTWFVKTFNHAFPFYLYAGFCVVLLVVMILWVPETKGKSLEEIEKQW